jgi:hypothetical protein
MTRRRVITQTLPDPPRAWDDDSQNTWRRLVQILEGSDLFDKGRRTLVSVAGGGGGGGPLSGGFLLDDGTATDDGGFILEEGGA